MPASLTTRPHPSQASPAPSTPSLIPPSSPRITSIDALRGLVMFTMIFVNDIAGAPHVPGWMKHYSDTAEGSGMTFVDVVFPAFLFIVGMSIPFALGARLTRGEPAWRILAHVLLRTLSLLAIGILMVNAESGPSPAQAGISRTTWAALLFAAAILAFCTLSPRTHPPAARARTYAIATIALRLLGVATLIVLAFIYRTDRGDRLITLHASWPPLSIRTQWYGILGLIGWAYLVASLAYLCFRTHRTALLGCTALLMSLFVADRAGAFNGLWLRKIVSVGEVLGSQASITVAGLLLATILLTPDTAAPSARARFTLLFILAFAAAALLLHRPYGIIKNEATPAWCLWACAITACLWLLFYFLADVWRLSFLTKPFAIAGQNVLLAYLLSDGVGPWLDSAHLGHGYDALAEPNLLHAVTRSAGVAVVILTLTALLNRFGFRLKL
jgi:predicted acyltransferase